MRIKDKCKFIFLSFLEKIINLRSLKFLICLVVWDMTDILDSFLLQVFNKDMDKDMIVLLAGRASRLENQDAIDAAIINMLADPKEVEMWNILLEQSDFFDSFYFCDWMLMHKNWYLFVFRHVQISRKFTFYPSIQLRNVLQ